MHLFTNSYYFLLVFADICSAPFSDVAEVPFGKAPNQPPNGSLESAINFLVVRLDRLNLEVKRTGE